MFRIPAIALAIVAMMRQTLSEPVTVCNVLSDENGKVTQFETQDIDPLEYDAVMASGAWPGPCSDYLGELCDDGDFCTIDYDAEECVCLPFPRDTVPDCAKA